MIWVDYCILVVLMLSTIIGIIRGFIRETFSLMTWILAFCLALYLSHPLAGFLERWISLPSARLVVAYAVLFLGGLVVGSLITYVISNFARNTPFAGPDRALGAGFGLLRGLVVATVTVMVAGFTPVRQDPWWQQSLLITPLESAGDWLHGKLSPYWLEQVKPGQAKKRT